MLTNRDERGKCSGAGRLAATASTILYRYKLVYNRQVPIHTHNVRWNEAEGVKMSWMLDHKGGCRFFHFFLVQNSICQMGRARVGGSEDYCGTLADRVAQRA
jgi:hypothetical protein